MANNNGESKRSPQGTFLAVDVDDSPAAIAGIMNDGGVPPTPRVLLGVAMDMTPNVVLNQEEENFPTLQPASRLLPSPPAEAVAAAAAALRARPSPSPSSGGSETRGKKKMSPGETSARQQQKKKTGPRISIQCRIQVTRKHLWPILKHEPQREVVKGYPDNYNFYGQVISGNNSSGYMVRFDLFPAEWKEVNVGRKRLGVVNCNEEELPFDRQKDNEQYSSIEPKRKAAPPMKQSELDFAALDEED